MALKKLVEVWDGKTKPIGSIGLLEETAYQILSLNKESQKQKINKILILKNIILFQMMSQILAIFLIEKSIFQFGREI